MATGLRVLDKALPVQVMCGSCELTIDGADRPLPPDLNVTVADLEVRLADVLRCCKFAVLHYSLPLRDEWYLFHAKDRAWYLVAEGPGFA